VSDRIAREVRGREKISVEVDGSHPLSLPRHLIVRVTAVERHPSLWLDFETFDRMRLLSSASLLPNTSNISAVSLEDCPGCSYPQQTYKNRGRQPLLLVDELLLVKQHYLDDHQDAGRFGAGNDAVLQLLFRDDRQVGSNTMVVLRHVSAFPEGNLSVFLLDYTSSSSRLVMRSAFIILSQSRRDSKSSS